MPMLPTMLRTSRPFAARARLALLLITAVLVLPAPLLSLTGCGESSGGESDSDGTTKSGGDADAKPGADGTGRPGAGASARGRGGFGGWGRQQPATAVEAAVVKTGTIPRILRTSGRLEARHDADIPAQVSGLVESVLVREGAHVTEGQLLATFDREIFDLALEDAQIDLDQAKEDTARAKLALDRAENDLQRATRAVEADPQFGDRIFTEEQISHLTHDRDVARREVRSAELRERRVAVALKRAERDMRLCEVRAPFDGVITAREIDPYDRIRIDNSMFTIVDPFDLELRVAVTESEASELAVGRSAMIVGRGRQALIYPAVVEEVLPAVDATRGLVDARLTLMPWRRAQQLELLGATHQVFGYAGGGASPLLGVFAFGRPGTTPPLKPGMFVTAEIATAVHTDATLVSKEGVLYEGDEAFVFRITPGNTVERVTVLLRDDFATDQAIEVERGLSPGDRVVIRQSDLKDGAPVTIADLRD
jgi:RND family efflux transporter MFP subunit